MIRVDDFRFTLRDKEYIPIMIGGMGVDISTTKLAFVAARLGGIGHISDAMVPAVSDKWFDTKYVKLKLQRFKSYVQNLDKTNVQFDLEELAKATHQYVSKTMEEKKGNGLIFLNCMEKLTMNNPRGTLYTRLVSAMDAGIDGITLSAGLHLGSFSMIKDHPRFHDVLLGIIVSSSRALKLFLRKSAATKRYPDYVIVEGPLAGGHLGFGPDNWQDFKLEDIVKDTLNLLEENNLNIPVIPAGGIFTGTDAVEQLQAGASAVQVATRFTVTHECGLPEKVKQEYFKASEENIVVNMLSPTGYPMRMINTCPAVGSNAAPNCEAYGYILDAKGQCQYLDSYRREKANSPDSKTVPPIKDKMCLCTHMRNYNCWTCGHYTYRLKDTTNRLADGSYQLLDAEHVYHDYQFSTNHEINIPEKMS